MIDITLTIDEINDILKVLGQLPTSSGAWPLLVKIKSQAEEKLREEQNVDKQL